MDSLLEGFRDPAWVIDPATQKILFANDAASDAYGYSKSEFTSMSLPCLAARNGGRKPGLTNGADSSEPLDLQIWLHFRKDGSSLLVRMTSEDLEAEGRRYRVFVAENVVDLLTGEKNWQANSEELKLLRTAVAHLNDVLIITKAEPIDEPGQGPEILYVNEAFETVTGFSREEAIGKTPRILQGPKTDRAELDRLRTALERWEPVRVELLNYTKTGESYWTEIEIVPLANAKGWFTHWVSVQRDITERRAAQAALTRSNEELAQSRKRFRELAELSADWFWETDLEQRYTFVSRDDALEQIGVGPEDMIGRTREEVFGSFNADKVVSEIQGYMDQKLPFHDVAASLDTGDGQERAILLSGRPFLDAGGRVTGYRGTGRDVTVAKRLEEQLYQSQKLEAVGKLTGGIAHDFNNVLNVIIGNAEIILEDPAAEEDVRELAEETLAAAERASELTSRLLSFSRQQPLEPRTTNLNAVLREIQPLLRRTLPENIAFEEVLDDDLWACAIDPGQLESAVLNLLLNARDAISGSGTIVIETHNALLDEEYAALEKGVKPGPYSLLVVSDSGDGMSPEIIANAIDPFFTTKEFGKGSGLGLSMVFGFVKQSDGHMKIYSEEGEGTTIRLYFPKVESKPEESFSKAARNSIPGGRERILVVEDDDLVRKQVVKRLERLGYEIMAANSAHEAMGIIEQGFDMELLFTDVVLPGGMSGRQLVDHLERRRPDLKVLFTSGYTENAIVHSGRLDNGVQLLSKPYRQVDLAHKIREMLDG